MSKCFTEDGKRVKNDKRNYGCKFRVLDTAADTSRSQVISLIRDLFYSINVTISAILREARLKRGLSIKWFAVTTRF